ncbi:MAG: hypothetical protein EAZ42_00965 [Verrucomicrobia bacterium]|nr:MAG: hypothetical protein EAZ42_00965 [Verrucomicrobiota bacterium]
MDTSTRDHGSQPLDELMEQWRLKNHDLVDISEEQLSHKQVQKARKGRQLTLHLMQKIMRTINAAVLLKLNQEQHAQFVPYAHKQLFNYAKGHDAGWQDPNRPLMPQ